MALEYRVQWNGTATTGPGISVFHSRSVGVSTAGAAAQDMADRCRALFLEIASKVPIGVTWSFPNEVTDLNTTTGVLEDVHIITSPVDVNSSATASNHARPAGARIDWNTTAVVNGRRLRGRTYIVPLSGGQYDTGGALSAGLITALETAGTNYLNASVFADAQPTVWSRTHGIQADIVAASVDDKASILRSRRD